MDGMLSQDEINALLQGMDLSDTADSGASPETPQDSSSAENTDNAYVKYQHGFFRHYIIFTGKPQSKYYHSGGYTGHMEDFAG